VQPTLATDGELSEFAFLRSFDDYFASELKGQLIHRRIKDTLHGAGVVCLSGLASNRGGGD